MRHFRSPSYRVSIMLTPRSYSLPHPVLAALTLASLAASSLPALAEQGIAISETAMSITGDITFDDASISFANGEELIFSALLDDSFVVGGTRVPASLYEVETPADPELENGNRLCGAGDVSYVASWAAPEVSGTGYVVAVFTGDTPPTSDAEMCASYTYE